jgi:hypothetical protein
MYPVMKQAQEEKTFAVNSSRGQWSRLCSMRTLSRTLLLIVATAVSGCATPRESAGQEPSLSEIFERSLAARSDGLIRHLISDRVYYYAVSGCCDQLNPVFDADGKYVCAPDGVFTGRGDGRCPAELVRVEWSQGTSVPNPFYRRR